MWDATYLKSLRSCGRLLDDGWSHPVRLSSVPFAVVGHHESV